MHPLRSGSGIRGPGSGIRGPRFGLSVPADPHSCGTISLRRPRSHAPAEGEHTANMIGSHPVPLRLCTVSFKSATGISHSVDVEAETLYEAAGIGLARLKKDGWVEGLGPGSRLEIAVREPSTMHSLTVQQLQRWANGLTTSPAEVLRRTKVKHLLGM